MRDLKHLIYFENLLQEANNELVQKAKADGWLVTAKDCRDADIIRWVNKAEQREIEKKMKQ